MNTDRKKLLLFVDCFAIASILICLVFFLNDSLSLVGVFWGYWVGIILSAILFYKNFNELEL